MKLFFQNIVFSRQAESVSLPKQAMKSGDECLQKFEMQILFLLILPSSHDEGQVISSI